MQEDLSTVVPQSEIAPTLNKSLWGDMYYGLWFEILSIFILVISFLLGSNISFALTGIGFVFGLVATVSFFIGLWKKSAPAWQFIVLGLLIFVIWPIVGGLGTLGLIR